MKNYDESSNRLEKGQVHLSCSWSAFLFPILGGWHAGEAGQTIRADAQEELGRHRAGQWLKESKSNFYLIHIIKVKENLKEDVLPATVPTAQMMAVIKIS